MKEIGGYIELDTYRLPMLHEGAIALNCGRNALAYLIHARKIKKLWIPKFLCNSITRVCEREGILYSLYSIGYDFRPAQEILLGDDEWLYFVNYYSQFDNEQIAEYSSKYHRIIVDNAQSYFLMPIQGIDTFYTCRKYFGVADGAFLYTDANLCANFPIDESFERMLFLLGRYERKASEFYKEFVANDQSFASEPIKLMSKLTKNLLHAVDYDFVKTTREQNYSYLNNALEKFNKLKLNDIPGTFMYPLLIENSDEVRRKLQENMIYVPTLWKDVFDVCQEDEIEYDMAKNILPLPIDQRYSKECMDIIVSIIIQYL